MKIRSPNSRRTPCRPISNPKAHTSPRKTRSLLPGAVCGGAWCLVENPAAISISLSVFAEAVSCWDCFRSLRLFFFASSCVPVLFGCSVVAPLAIMSDDEHHFESKADAGASKTFPQQAGTIRKGAYLVIKNRPCKVVEVSTSKTGKHGHAKCHFVAIDIFTGKKLEDIVPSSHNCDVPEVVRTDYQLIDVSDDGFVSLLTDSGETKDDLKLPTDEALLTQLKQGFGEGKDLVVTVMSAMGEEQIAALKDVGHKN